MTEAEALRIAARYLATHHCHRCDKTWLTGASVRTLFHKCHSSPQPIRNPPDRDEDRQQWAARLLGDYTPTPR